MNLKNLKISKFLTLETPHIFLYPRLLHIRRRLVLSIQVVISVLYIFTSFTAGVSRAQSCSPASSTDGSGPAPAPRSGPRTWSTPTGPRTRGAQLVSNRARSLDLQMRINVASVTDVEWENVIYEVVKEAAFIEMRPHLKKARNN